MKSKIELVTNEINDFKIEDVKTLENFRIHFLGSKGIIKDLFSDLKAVPNEEKREVGQLLNGLRTVAEEKLAQYKEQLESNSSKENSLDLSRTADDWHNFSALNFAPEHPARDMQDTFFIEKGENEMALRTHTSSVQVRVMENSTPPIRTISPGRVYRNEAISARAHCFFHQVEGLYIDKNVSFADLKQTLLYFAKELFGEKAQIRMRPSYFPFTEPSAEVDVSCSICNSKGCNVCKYTGWLEILGCGMVDPAVLEASGIDSKVYSGFAFGMGVERITQLKYKVNDLRLYSENDVRFLKQFTAGI
jgi:phenylalanyl-tRNA synthetase alpha chain